MSGLDYRFRRKRHRLELGRYVGCISVAFTISVLDRKRLFDDPVVVDKLLEVLRVSLERQDCEAPIYCFMPDHLHVLVRGKSEASQVKEAISRFKISAGIWLRHHKNEYRLNHDFYDHIVKSGEDWRGQAQYIAMNPVRGGLIADPMLYERTGCIGMNRDEMLQEIFFSRG